MRSTMCRTATGALLALFLAAPAFADTLILKNGRRIEGRIVQESEKDVTIEHAGSYLTFERRFVSKVERTEDTPTKTTPKPAPADPNRERSPAVPAGATEDEAERWRSLLKQLREAVQRCNSARKDLDKARLGGDQESIRLANERSQVAERELDRIRGARATIQRAVQSRLAQAERTAKAEADGLRSALEVHRAASDVEAVTAFATDLDSKTGKIPEGEEARRRRLREVAADAWSSAGELGLALAEKKQDRAAARAAGVAFTESWGRFEQASPQKTRQRLRAIEAYTLAHRLTRRAVPYDIELGLSAIHAFEAVATLVEERLGPRRWGPVPGNDEGGRFKVEMGENQVVYTDEIPTARNAVAAWERRESEGDAPPPAGTPKVIGKSRTERWYELVWFPAQKVWARETDALKLDAKLPAVARRATPVGDELGRVRDERFRAGRELDEAKEKLARAIREADEGMAGEDAVNEAHAGFDKVQKQVTDLDRRFTELSARVKELQGELASLIRSADRARKD